MSATPWYQNTLLLVLACLIVPPVGLVLLWFHPGLNVLRKSAASAGLVVLTVVHLFLFYGLRMELGGTGTTPIFTFHDPESHFEDIEESREATVQAASLTPSVSSGVYWSDYRGPGRAGSYAEQTIRTDWPDDGLPELWRQKIGGGYASVVVARGRVFTIEQRRDREVVAAYDFGNGRELWSHGWEALFQESMGGDGPRATPVWHEGKVYALGATGELRCLKADTGELVWRKNILEDNGSRNLTWAMAASPLIVDEKLIVLPGGRGGKSVVAYHKETGEPIWRSLDDKQAYVSPMAATLAGRRQLVVISAPRLMGVAIEDGSLLWDYPWVTSYDADCAQPIIVDENHVFVSSGYGHGAALVKIASEGDSFRAEEVWKNLNMKNKFNSSVLHESHVYGLDEGILASINVRTGERNWKGGRYGYGQVLLADGHLIVLTERGDVVLVEATPAGHRELARFSALEGKTWNNPAIAEGRLIVRNQTEMACYDLRAR